jgi:hypothetical protein
MKSCSRKKSEKRPPVGGGDGLEMEGGIFLGVTEVFCMLIREFWVFTIADNQHHVYLRPVHFNCMLIMLQSMVFK